MRYNRRSIFSMSYWPGFTDLMSSLLLLFIFLAFYQYFSRFDFWQSIIIKAKQGQLLEEFSNAFPEEVKKSLINITTDGNLQKISYSNKLLFDSGKVELKNPSYLNHSAKIFKKMGEGVFKSIQVEGFTDSKPINAGDNKLHTRGIRDNWDLSVARAVEVVRHLQYNYGINPKLLSATGYSWYQSQSNQTTQDRRQNRKIEIVLVYSMIDLKKSLSLKHLNR